ANNEINAKETQAITNINEAKENATTQITANKQEVLNNITQEKESNHYQNIDFFEIELGVLKTYYNTPKKCEF
ncbi:hypothetical protein JT241_01970, partial [Helicobacter pylori]|nr:hypothetical protein [Helicobacter pylori]